MRLLTIAIAALFISLPALACEEHEKGHHHEAAAAPQQSNKAKGETIHVGVDGMVCDFCAQSLKKEFKKEKAVQDVAISLEDKMVTLTLKPQTKLDDAAIKKHIDYAGYKVTKIHHMPAGK